MSIIRLQRVTMHPWIWLGVVKIAIVRHTKAPGLSMVARRKAAEVLKLLDSKWDADFNVASPYTRLPKRTVDAWEKRNAEILQKDPVYGMFQEDEVKDGRVVNAGWRHVPSQALKTSVDLTEAQRDYCVEAVEALAKEPEIDNTNAMGIVDAVDLLKKAEEVEIDTERVLRAVP